MNEAERHEEMKNLALPVSEDLLESDVAMESQRARPACPPYICG